MGRDSGEGMLAIVSEVPVHLPGLSKIVRSFNQHGSWSEGLEANDDVREMKLCLRIEAYRDILHSVFGLPPRKFISVDDILDIVLLFRYRRIAEEALLSVLEMRNDAESFGALEAACRRGDQFVLTADQQIPGCGITRALLAGMRSFRVRSSGLYLVPYILRTRRSC